VHGLGFVRTKSGTITTFDAPGAGTGYSQGTYPLNINTAGQIEGYYVDASGVSHGFLRAVSGSMSTFDAPGGGQGITPIGMNAAQTITGGYTDSNGALHGFVRTSNGTITSFDAPGAGTNILVASLVALFKGPPTEGTGGISINTAGTIAGIYADPSVVYHGFVRAAAGTITPFSIPAAGTGTLEGTLASGINTAGKVTGTYLDASSVLHGFILTPSTTTLTSSPNPSTFGQTVTFTAVVTSKGGAPADGETVSFMQGSTLLGTGMLSGGTATFATSTLPVGKDSITAVYGNDSSLLGSTSKVVKQVVKAAK
jgi:hypothetical protein